MNSILHKTWEGFLSPMIQRPKRMQVAALCHRDDGQTRRYLLITSRGTGRWIVPKGWPIKGQNSKETALQEAWEEAGVKAGKASKTPIGTFTYEKRQDTGWSFPVKTLVFRIGANDVANNMGPAVGANALSMCGAIAIAIIFESEGALLAGGDVVSTVAKGIIAPESMGTAEVFIWAMMAALLSAALLVNLATWVSAPVSTTLSVVGGVMGAGIAAAGFAAVSWPTMGKIAASWVISPVLGGYDSGDRVSIRRADKPQQVAESAVWYSAGGLCCAAQLCTWCK